MPISLSVILDTKALVLSNHPPTTHIHPHTHTYSVFVTALTKSSTRSLGCGNVSHRQSAVGFQDERSPGFATFVPASVASVGRLSVCVCVCVVCEINRIIGIHPERFKMYIRESGSEMRSAQQTPVLTLYNCHHPDGFCVVEYLRALQKRCTWTRTKGSCYFKCTYSVRVF